MPGVGPIGELLAPILPPADYMDNDRIWTKAQALQAGVDMTKAKIHPEPLGSSSSSSTRGAGNVPRWPGNTDGIEDRPYLLIPYRFSNGAHTSIAGSQEYISDSFDMISADTGGCIRFVDDSVDQAHSHWVDIQDSPTGGCVSYVGYLGAFTSQFPNGQMLNLNPGNGPGTSGTCLASYVVNHEMLHALGFNHEQERFDRDDHVTIHMDRVQLDKQHNFEKLSAQEWFDMSSPYDGQSVMHYSAYSFQTTEASDAGLPTITNLAGEPVQWPRVQRLSSTDVLQLAKMYEGFCGQPGGEFIKVRTCTDGAQYLENRACDGIADCADGSDEEAAFCASLCEPDTFHVSENGCNDSQDWTGAYPKMAEGAYPKSLTISLDGGDASNGFEAGTFIRMDQADWCFDTPDIPSYKRVGQERFIWPMPGGAWYMGSSNCASSLNYYYFPSQNGNVANFWDLEAPLFNRWTGSWVTSDNQRFKKGAEGWQNGDFILSQAADGSWSISDSSSSISLGNNACVTGDHADGIKVSELASSSSSCAGTTTTTTTLAPTTSFTTTDVTTSTTTTTTTPSITTTTISAEQCEENCQPGCDIEFGAGEKNCACDANHICQVCDADFLYDPTAMACLYNDPCACTDGVKNAMKRNEKALWKWQMMRPLYMTNTMSSWMISSSSAANRDQYQGYLILSRKTCKQLVLNMFKDDPEFDFSIMDLRERDTTHPMPNYSAFENAYYRNHADENKNHRSITIGFSVNKTQPDITGNLKKDAYILNLSYPNGLPDGVTWEDVYNCLNMAKPVTIPTGPNDLAEHGHDPTCDYSSCVGEDVMVGF